MLRLIRAAALPEPRTNYPRDDEPLYGAAVIVRAHDRLSRTRG